MDYIDIHCHILPGIDDGAADIQEMKEMLAIARADGIRKIICTPHYHIGHMKTEPEQIQEALKTIRETVNSDFPDMAVYPGQEIYYYSEALEKLEEGSLLTLAETDYVLLEYATSSQYEVIRDSISQLWGAGFLPVIAHAERYGCLFGNVNRIRELVRTGAYIQVNAESLQGFHTNPMRRFLMKLLKADLVHFIASDAHSVKSRKPKLSKAYEIVENKTDKDQAKRIFIENPELLLDNKEL